MRASERAYQSLREDVIEWRLEPGRVLSEVEQAQRLDLSRTPVREAFSRLLADGLVEAHPGRGVVVAQVSPEKVRQMYSLRIVLETEAAGLAAASAERAGFHDLAERLQHAADAEFLGEIEHADYYGLVREMDSAIDAATGNEYLVQAQRSLRNHLERVRKLSKSNAARLREAAAEHAEIARAIARGRPELARAATRLHLTHSMDLVLTAVDHPAGVQAPHSDVVPTTAPVPERTLS